MRSYPEDDSDREDLAKLNAEPWMVELLKLNPEYVHWGPHEDYMWVKGDGWNSPVEVQSWKEFKWQLDELNECANFYFEINRASKKCGACDETGYNKATQAISEDFYDFAETGRRWRDKITQDEVEALQEAGRLRTWNGKEWERKPVTAEVVNAANARGVKFSMDYDHDGINRCILIKTRAKRLGVYGHCPECDGQAFKYTEPAAKLGLVLWMLHPRKGCSRGVEVKSIEREDLPAVFTWLREADKRNRDRFYKIPSLCESYPVDPLSETSR